MRKWSRAVAAEFGRLAGWLAFDSEQPALAQRYFMAAVHSAHLSGDRAIGANIISFMSIQAAFSDNPRDVMTLAESVLQAEEELSPAVAVSLHAQMALSAAYAGDTDVSRRAQNRAFERLSQSTPSGEPQWIYWFTEADAHGIAGQSPARRPCGTSRPSSVTWSARRRRDDSAEQRNRRGLREMTQRRWYGTDPLMAPVDRIPLAGYSDPARDEPLSASPVVRPFGVRLARIPVHIDASIPVRLGEHSKTYTVDKKTENTKVIIDGNEENHPDTSEVERETD